jgi:hypothetical protein
MTRTYYAVIRRHAHTELLRVVKTGEERAVASVTATYQSYDAAVEEMMHRNRQTLMQAEAV